MCKWLKEITVYKGKGEKIKATKCTSEKRIKWFRDASDNNHVHIDLIIFEPGYEPCKACSFKEEIC